MMDENPESIRESWVLKLDKEIAEDDILGKMLKQFLLSDGSVTVADTASEVDLWFRNECISDRPWLATEPESFLNYFYRRVFAFVRHIPYNSSGHDQLVQLIQDLQKMSPSPCKVWNVCCDSYALVFNHFARANFSRSALCGSPSQSSVLSWMVNGTDAFVSRNAFLY